MVIPPWLLEVSPRSALNARDFRQVLGLKPATFDRRLKAGIIPVPDFCARRAGANTNFGFYSGNRKNDPREWYVKTVLTYLKTLP
jgi:hypothetical protein